MDREVRDNEFVLGDQKPKKEKTTPEDSIYNLHWDEWYKKMDEIEADHLQRVKEGKEKSEKSKIPLIKDIDEKVKELCQENLSGGFGFFDYHP